MQLRLYPKSRETLTRAAWQPSSHTQGTVLYFRISHFCKRNGTWHARCTADSHSLRPFNVTEMPSEQIVKRTMETGRRRYPVGKKTVLLLIPRG